MVSAATLLLPNAKITFEGPLALAMRCSEPTRRPGGRRLREHPFHCITLSGSLQRCIHAEGPVRLVIYAAGELAENPELSTWQELCSSTPHSMMLWPPCC